MAAPLALLALLVELIAGYPKSVMAAIGHPVTWMGRLIATLDKQLNIPSKSPAARRHAGVIALVIVVLIVGAAAFVVESILLLLPFGLLLAGIAGSSLIAQRSLYAHVASVRDALQTGDIVAAREKASQIVGRDTADLDEAGVARAAIESLAENFSDAVVAPVFWIVLGGLTGGAVYKAINTADSMIGHRTERYEDFGKASARLDDLVNLPGSRLSTLFIVAAAAMTGGASARKSWEITLGDAPQHASPNAGYPEAAMAGALGLSLGGPRRYGSAETQGAWLGDGRREATAADLHAALGLYKRADALLIALVLVLAILTQLT